MHIPTTTAPLPFTPPALGPDTPVVFLIRPQAQVDLDRLGYELFRHNIVPLSSDDFRAAMIDEIFAMYEGAEGERRADLIDEHWQADDLYKQRMEDWVVQEDQRILDEAHGAPRRVAPEPPKHTQPLRERNEATMVISEVRRGSMRLRSLTVEQMTFEAKQREGIVRLVLDGWRGLETPFALVDDMNGEGGIVPDDAWRAVKGEIGPIAVQQLLTHVGKVGEVDRGERGNSDSLLEKPSGQTGSPALNGGSASSDGSSTSAVEASPSTSSLEPTPDVASDPTTGSSFNSTSDLTGESASTAEPPMGAE